MGSKLNNDGEKLKKDKKVGADGLGESKGATTLEQYFSDLRILLIYRI